MGWQSAVAGAGTAGVILHLDIDAAPPARLDFNGHNSLLVIVWKGDRPLSMQFCQANGPPVSLPDLLSRLGPQDGAGDILDSPPARPLPAVTVAVCTRDRPRLLAACLDSISRQSLLPAEVLVVDNAPSNDGAWHVAIKHPECRYVREECRGIARARNRAVQEARGEIVAFVDDDCLLVPNWTRRIAGWFARQPNLGCVTGPVLPLELDTPAQELIERRGGYSKGFSTRIFTRDSGPHASENYPVQAWLFGTGASMAFSREHLLAIGGFNEAVQAEDLDVFYRLLCSGRELIYEPGATVLHRHPRELAALRRNFRAWGKGYVQFLCKVAASNPHDRPKAQREICNWLFRYQCKALLLGKISQRNYPRGMIAQEIAGGVSALLQHLLHRRQVAPRSTRR